MTLLSKIALRLESKNISKNSDMGRILRRHGVRRTADFRRIEALPRRVWDADATRLDRLRIGLTEMLRPEGFQASESSLVLRSIQAAAIEEAHDHKGAFLPISVGAGKALIGLLIPVVLQAERPVLFVPVDLREQTKAKVIPQAQKHFVLHPGLKIVANSELSLAKNSDMLERLSPDLIILDECHEYNNTASGRTKRMNRWMKDNPTTIMVAMSGTITSRSIRDYQHILRWCLGDSNCPLPIKWQGLSDWADALDEGVPEQARMAPGALARFCRGQETPRQGYSRRLTETPGVVASGAEELRVSLKIRRLPGSLPPVLTKMLNNLQQSWEDPNGGAVAEAVDIWRISRQLALGFWYEWDPPAPRAWLDARREWKGYVRGVLKHNRRKLDTELQVWNEASTRQPPEWQAWEAVKASFKPNPVARWLDPYVIDVVRQWFGEGPGIVWVEHTAIGKRLSEELHVPFFGPGKQASRNILDAHGPAVASIKAHHRGKNLQGQWHRNLVTASPSSGKMWEQLLGRTHRPGQPKDTVFFDVVLYDGVLMDSFRQAQADAVYLEDTLGTRQRLNYADITF